MSAADSPARLTHTRTCGARARRYGRLEALAGFVNTLALAYAALHIFSEAIGRLLDPPKIQTDDLLTVSFLGLVVNLVGVFAFEHGGHGHSHGGGNDHGHSHAHGGAHDDSCDDEGRPGGLTAALASPPHARALTHSRGRERAFHGRARRDCQARARTR